MSERREKCDRWRQLTEVSARLHAEIMDIARAKNFEARDFTPEEAARIAWLNSEGNRVEAEREAIDRGMLAELRGSSPDPGAEATQKLIALQALPYAPVPPKVRQKQLELARQPICDPQRALEILERKKREGDTYSHILRVIAERAYADRPYTSWASSRPGVNWRPQVRDRGLRQRVRTPWVAVTARKARNNT